MTLKRLALANLLLWWQLASLGLFLAGFFPVKRPLEGVASTQDVHPEARERYGIFYFIILGNLY